MIAFIKGTVYSFGLDHVIIETVSGIGYKVYYNHSQPLTLGQNILLFTYQQIREDAHVLFGFMRKEELELFEKLISVKGLGPKTALGILTAASYSQVVNAIEQGEVAFLKKMPGIGAKTASQIILDLKGKLVSTEESKPVVNSKIMDAMEALKALGYKNAEIQAISKQMQEQDLATAEAYVKLGLQLLLKRKGG
ncbi:MAG: Holliday junction branch migration protein RuvA [Erysipelotrichaceae bacterium]|nr:Holliday junction branch migration protein RuvA [Erysipelotrichaceae bacterium]MBQ9840205.1 Holliday junction branch migration protein RuvA [Erysipelotrichaceae bacterium]